MWSRISVFFETLEDHPFLRFTLLVAGLLFFWIIEGAIPLIQLHYKKNKLRHAAVNFGFTLIHLVIHTLLAILIVLLADWCQKQSWGLVYWFHANIPMTILIGVLALDFSSWLVHWVMHKTSLLWRFHLIHHADNNVDVTTGLRHHPGDSILRGIFFLLLNFVSGAPVYAVMIYQTLIVLSTAFTHANISLPRWLDNALSYILVSPNMHKVHHHWKQPYTDSNYGAVFSIWDRLFGTYKKLDPKEIHYGLDRYYPNEKDEDFIALLKKPFQKLE
ncbi:MAG TPA: sterol desaturase family protein [Chitinophagaceae bacterium]|nr:sterol desaturase family protein [Chitinophagaceae bacterium]